MQDLQFPAFRVSQGLLDWLLQGDEPSVRYQTLVQLPGKDETSREAEDAERQIGRVGWAARILGEQKESTYWDNPETCYVPKYASCIWKLIVLADLGVSGEDQRIKNSIEHFFGLHNVETGGFALRPKGSEKFDPHVCATGNMVRTLARPLTGSSPNSWQTVAGTVTLCGVESMAPSKQQSSPSGPYLNSSKTILELSGKNRQREHQSSS